MSAKASKPVWSSVVSKWNVKQIAVVISKYIVWCFMARIDLLITAYESKACSLSSTIQHKCTVGHVCGSAICFETLPSFDASDKFPTLEEEIKSIALCFSYHSGIGLTCKWVVP